MVDEFQDINKVQYELIKLLSAESKKCMRGWR
ncbi:UvrD-helicase domain-containing protein [Peribacillus frigoritolerans]|nr:UvrD-helicase domain-containing protein [Peribacillus frigoritolerans]